MSITCEEGLSEVEAGDPEHVGSSMINPVLEELESGQEVVDVASQRFEGWVGLAGPGCWDPSRHHALKDILQL